MRPELSIIIPCFKEPKELLSDLRKQSYRNYEVLLQKEGRITDACNAGIKRAKGRYILFLEDDNRILDKNWLREFHKGLEKYNYIITDHVLIPSINPPFHLNNVGIDAKTAKENNFTEGYKQVEDFEWYEKLRSRGLKPVYLRKPVNYHFKKITFVKSLRRSFYYGAYYCRIASSYKDPAMNYSRIIKSWAFDSLNDLMKLAGIIYGTLRFSYRFLVKTPERNGYIIKR